MCEPRNSFEFLKRIHVSEDPETIHVQQNPRHFEKLFEDVGIQCHMNPKKVPCHELMNAADDSPQLQPRQRIAQQWAFSFTSQVIWWSACTIRDLAQSMSCPTERSWSMLKHLCLYLLSVRDHS